MGKHNKKQKIDETSSGVEVSPVSSPSNTTYAPSVFKTPHLSETNKQRQVQFSVDPVYLFLLSELLNELKAHNAIALAKMQLDADQKREADEQKQKELEAAREAELEDQARSKEVCSTMFI